MTHRNLILAMSLAILLALCCPCSSLDMGPATCKDRSDASTQDLPVPQQASLPGHIVFLSKRDGAVEIYMMRADGSESFRLTNNQQVESDLAASPDGKTLAFVSGGDLYSLDLACARQSSGCQEADWKLLAKGISHPSWTPDGQEIYGTLYYPESLIPGGSADIVVVKPDSSGYDLTNTGTAYPGCGDCAVKKAWDPIYSPRGSVILHKNMTYPSGKPGWGLWYKEDVSFKADLGAIDSIDRHPAFSPDEAQLAWDSAEGVCTQNIDGSNQPTLWTPGQNAAYPVFSPDGKWMAFASDSGGDMDIYVMETPHTGFINRGGKSQINLSQNSAWDSEPIWVP